jgi:glyoxylase-like metal-dependent hydrolase (beta-lactamase superfamily II)
LGSLIAQKSQREKPTMKTLKGAIVLLIASWSWPTFALETVKVTDNIYAFVGEKQQRSATNLANNATFGLIVTDEGAILVDPGGSWKGAQALHAAIRSVTDKPVRFVVNTGGQDHRWLGNGYWRKQGATIIASNAAVADHKERGSLQLTMLTQLLGDKLAGTDPAYADVTFDDAYTLKLGNLSVEIRHVGQAHTPGDAFVWVPAQSTVFAGDIVYLERLLGVMAFSSSKSWLTSFEAIAALKPNHVVPGHGAPSTLPRAKADTYDYLVNLRNQIGAHIEKGGDMIGSVKVDQTAFKHLEQFDALAGRNAQAVFAEMEFE